MKSRRTERNRLCETQFCFHIGSLFLIVLNKGGREFFFFCFFVFLFFILRVLPNLVSGLRAPQDREHSRFRKNSYPYQPSHGLGLTSSGFVEGQDQYGSFAYEISPSLPMDASASLPNWFCTDIEKISIPSCLCTCCFVPHLHIEGSRARADATLL